MLSLYVHEMTLALLHRLDRPSDLEDKVRLLGLE